MSLLEATERALKAEDAQRDRLDLYIAKQRAKAGLANCPPSDGSAISEYPPPMDPCAYYGICGEIVQTLDSHTEERPGRAADPGPGGIRDLDRAAPSRAGRR